MKKADELTRRRFVADLAKTFLGVGLFQTTGANWVKAKTIQRYNRPAVAKNIIYLYMNGGMSHLDTFDPKPDKANIQGPMKTMRTSAEGVRISEFLPKVARQMDKATLINSMNTNQGAHEHGNYMMHTSYPKRSTIRHPSLGAWMTKLGGHKNESLPASVVIGGNSQMPGAGFFEAKYAPLMIGNPYVGLKNSQRAEGVTEQTFKDRLDMVKELDQAFLQKYPLKKVQAYTDMYDDALRLMQSKDLEAFNLNNEPEAIRSAYGANHFGQGCLLARRLVENHVRFVEVNLSGWDTHSNNFGQMAELSNILDQGMGTLIEDLYRRGMLGDTLVVLATEFGRTPEINVNEGRDHHPGAFTCLLAGGGMQAGLQFGKTDSEGREVAEGLVSVEDFNATIAHALGLPLERVVKSPSGRPFTVAHKGKPIMDLFA